MGPSTLSTGAFAALYGFLQGLAVHIYIYIVGLTKGFLSPGLQVAQSRYFL